MGAITHLGQQPTYIQEGNLNQGALISNINATDRSKKIVANTG
jgi:hypothetical protein